MAYWVKVSFERDEYIIDLDRISAFACAPNGKITFWLPEKTTPIILTKQNRIGGYDQVSNYIEKVIVHSLTGNWIRLSYDRCQYVIDLNRISGFSCNEHGKLTFWIPGSISVMLTKQSDPDNYQKIKDFILRNTGCSFC